MKKLLYPLLAAALLAPLPWQQAAEAAPQPVSATAERKDDNLKAVMDTVQQQAVRQVLDELAPDDGSAGAARLRQRVLRNYKQYVLHIATQHSRHTQKYTTATATVTVDRDALAERVAALQAALPGGTGRACFLLRVSGALDKAAAEALLQQHCAAQYAALGLQAGSGELPEEAKTTQLTPMSNAQYDRFTNYMLDKLDQKWLDYQLALAGEVALSTVPGEDGVTRCARVRVRALDADAHRVLAELLQEYTATAATAAEAEQLVLQQAADDFAATLGQKTLEELQAQKDKEAAAAKKKK